MNCNIHIIYSLPHTLAYRFSTNESSDKIFMAPKLRNISMYSPCIRFGCMQIIKSLESVQLKCILCSINKSWNKIHVLLIYSCIDAAGGGWRLLYMLMLLALWKDVKRIECYRNDLLSEILNYGFLYIFCRFYSSCSINSSAICRFWGAGVCNFRYKVSYLPYLGEILVTGIWYQAAIIKSVKVTPYWTPDLWLP